MSEISLVWHRAHRIFPVIYQEAMLSADDQIPITTFSSRIARRLRLAGHRASVIDGNKILIADVAVILSTRNSLDAERQSLLAYLARNHLHLGYMIQVADIPVWSCVQISSTQFISETPTLTPPIMAGEMQVCKSYSSSS